MRGPTDYKRKIAVTGGAGFIGSNLLLYLVPRHADYLFVNLDCLTYAGNLSNLRDVETAGNYVFQKIDIRDAKAVRECFNEHRIDGVIHLAAESHVDRSIEGPAPFIETNFSGTFNLLEAALSRAEATSGRFRFHHVSTDEVYGSLGATGHFSENTPYCPNSPYSASKAAGDHLVRAYHVTYGLDTVTTNCSNNFGPYQFPEKLIPLTVMNAGAGEPIPVYGDGKHIRDWLYVLDHCEALDLVFHKGASGRTYNVGGHNEIENIELVRQVCRIMDELLGGGPREKLVTFVKDRPGHDRRYAIDASLIAEELGWRPRHTLKGALSSTVKWYLDHQAWLHECMTGEYKRYYDKMYTNR